MPQQAGESTALDANQNYDLHSNISGANASPGASNTAPNQALPVELADFSATLEGKNAVLQWRTLSEQNNSGFAVQHRRPGNSSFERVGFRDGQGTTSKATFYRFRVSDLEPGTHAFQLRQVDLDGSSTLTGSVSVEMSLDRAFTWTMAPNPIRQSGRLSVRFRETQEGTVELFDVLGRQVQTIHSGTLEAGSRHQMTVGGQTLSNGSYLLRIEGESFSDTQKVTVVK